MCVCVCVCVNSYADPSPGRYAGSHYLVLLYISAYMNHYFPTNLEPRHGLWWPMCLVLCSAARWRAALKPLRCLCIPVLLRGCLPSCISSSLPCDLQKLILLDNILGEHIQYFPVEDDSGVDEGWHVFAEKAIRRAEASWLTLANSYCLVRISNMPMLSHDLCFLVINNIESLTSQNSFFFLWNQGSW